MQICFRIVFDRLEIEFRTTSQSPSRPTCPHELGDDPQWRPVDLSCKETSKNAAIDEVLK
jgi:hypothetical protein